MTVETRANLVNVAVGLCFVALGILLLLQGGGLIEMRELIRLWPVALILVGGAMAWQASQGGPAPHRSSVGGLIWLLILGMVFAHTFDRRAKAEATSGEGQVNMFAVMGGDRKPGVDGAFTGGQITTVMGGANLDLRRSTIAPGEPAVVDLFTVMGGVEIRVPREWRVDVQTMTIMGAVKDERGRREPTPREADAGSENRPPTDAAGAPGAVAPVTDAPHLVLKGTVVMGGVTIKQ